jgi:hypothetical protein
MSFCEESSESLNLDESEERIIRDLEVKFADQT